MKKVLVLISLMLVSCASVKNYDVIKLDLSNKELEELPEDIDKYVNLKVLNLRNNKFKKFPTQVSSLPNLEKLLLSNNNIGSMPKEILDNKKLEVLYLDGNNILSFINLKPMENLKLISISHNPIRSIESLECMIPKEAQILYGIEFPTIKGSDCKESN